MELTGFPSEIGSKLASYFGEVLGTSPHDTLSARPEQLESVRALFSEVLSKLKVSGLRSDVAEPDRWWEGYRYCEHDIERMNVMTSLNRTSGAVAQLKFWYAKLITEKSLLQEKADPVVEKSTESHADTKTIEEGAGTTEGITPAAVPS